mmetsp:Transcript_16412/g.29120  ORF Transcript_16412/g.29120 Transcript_16412/m.29120 type:complete len:80 (+) Transcript_16412:3922-4161(+)
MGIPHKVNVPPAMHATGAMFCGIPVAWQWLFLPQWFATFTAPDPAGDGPDSGENLPFFVVLPTCMLLADLVHSCVVGLI